MTSEGDAAEAIFEAGPSIGNVAARASVYSVALSAAGVGASYATNVVLGHNSAATLGTFALVTTVAMFWVTLLVFGGTNVVVHFASGRATIDQRRFVSSYGALVALLLALGLGAVAVFPGIIGAIFGAGAPGLNLLAISAIVVASAVSIIGVAYSQSRLAVFRSAIGQTLTALCVAAGVGASAAFGILNPHSVQIVLAIAWICAAVAVLLVSGLVPVWPRVSDLDPSFWAYAIPFHMSTIALFLTSNADIIAASRVLPVDQVGVYKVAMLGRQLVQWGPAMMLSPAYAILRRCEVGRLGAQFTHLVRRYISVATAVSVAATGGLLGLSGVFVRIFGHGYGSAVAPLTILIAGSGILFPLGAVAGAAVVAKGRVRASLGVNVVTALVGIPLGVALAQAWGLVGLAVASVCVLAMSTFLTWSLMEDSRVVGTLEPVLKAVLCVGILVAVRLAFGLSWQASLAIMTLGCIVPFAVRLVSVSDLRQVIAKVGRR